MCRVLRVVSRLWFLFPPKQGFLWLSSKLCLTWGAQLSRRSLITYGGDSHGFGCKLLSVYTSLMRADSFICYDDTVLAQSLADAQVELSASITVGQSLHVSHMPMPACRPNRSSSSRDRKGKRNRPFRVFCMPLCQYLNGGYLKCSGAVLLAPFEGLNEGLRGSAEHFSQCVRVRMCMHVGAFFWACMSMCVRGLECMCALGRDQRSKSTLERVAQSSSPTQLSPFLALPLSSHPCSSAPSSCGVE